MTQNHGRSFALFLVLTAFPWTFSSGCDEQGDESRQTSEEGPSSSETDETESSETDETEESSETDETESSETDETESSETEAGPAKSDGGRDSDGGAGTGGTAGRGDAGAGGTRDGGVDAGADGSGSPEAGGGDACQRGQVAGNEVLIVGDSYFPASRSALPNELRRLAGGADYRDVSVPGTKMAAIAASYTRNRTPPPKVVIMDGGGNDILQGWGCEAGCAQHEQAVTDARNFFKTMAMDGSVKQVVFIFYYDMPAIKDGLDWMRPRMEAECQMSPVPCFFVDNQPLFAGQDASEYTTDGIHPTAEAAKIIAKQAWDVMVTNCIAQ